jgi:hypothetical protein
MGTIKIEVRKDVHTLYKQLKTSGSVPRRNFQPMEIREALIMLIQFNDFEDRESEDDFLEDIGWYDPDFGEGGSRFDEFLKKNNFKKRKSKK